MSENSIKSKVSKKFKDTTNSNHKLPIAKNILDRDFSAKKPNEKMVSDITYVWTDEGWLYEKHFKTRDETRAAVFEYVEIFYNRRRIHASNCYITPEQNYKNATKDLKVA